MWQHPSTTDRLNDLERLFRSFFNPPQAGDHSPDERRIFRALEHMENRIMSAFTDLKDAITELGNQLTANNAEIDALLARIATPGTSDADIAALTQQVRGLIASNKSEVDKAVAAAG